MLKMAARKLGKSSTSFFFGLVMFLERIIKWSEYAKITDEKNAGF